jgi:hypothetical protein
MTSREMMADAMKESREEAKQQILDKIQEFKSMSSMSYLTGIIALQLVEVFIKFMDEE